MKKISTLFKKDPNDLGRVIDEIDPQNQWVLSDDSIATHKHDGTAAAIIGGELYKRYDAKNGKTAPYGAIPCQEADPISGHHPHWLKCDRANPEDRYFFEAFDKYKDLPNGTYELCGPKIGKNPERLPGHVLIMHGIEFLDVPDLSFEGLRAFLAEVDIEGIVFHNLKDGRMCKIRKRDFGIKRTILITTP